MKRATRFFNSLLLSVTAICLAGNAAAQSVSAEVAELIERDGNARVIVRLKTAFALRSEPGLDVAAVQRQRSEIARVQRDAGSRITGTASRTIRTFSSLPFVAMNLDAAGLARLTSQDSPVDSIYPDRVLRPLLVDSTYQIEADLAHAAGMDGAGSTVVVIDTGAEKSHPFLSGKVVHEACFATNDSGRKGACPNGRTSQVGNGAGEPCTFDPLSCHHGTHVSGIVLGSNATMTGVAPGATLIPIQVFHKLGFCSPLTACADASVSDVVAALEHVYDIRNDFPIAAVNMSLGGGLYNDVCDADYPLMTAAIDNLKSVGIATIAAAGNNGDPGNITTPACISSAISVGAVDEQDNVAYFSNGATQVDLLAPGTDIDSSVPGGGYSPADGTSMATPHVAGAWAIMRQAYGPQPVDAELELLKTTGAPVTDNRNGFPVTLPRVRLGPAAGIINPLPVLSSVSPNSVTAGADHVLTVSGSGFVRSSVVIADGTTIPTTFVSDTQIEAVLPKSMLGPGVESVSLVVESPTLGGGTSAPVSIDVLQPEISLSATTVNEGDVVTVTLTNSPGNRYDWMVLVPVGAPSSSWFKMTFVPSFQTGMTWNVSMPTTPGEYEVRLLEDNSYNELAVSETITVGEVVEPPPGGGDAAISLSTTIAEPGETVTATMTGGPGNQYDWMVLVPVGAPSSGWVKMTFVPQFQTGMTWNVAMPATPGEYEIRLLESNSYNALAVSETIMVGDVVEPPPGGEATITVSATDVEPGETVVATMTGGPGNQYDWMVLVPVGAPSSGWVKMTFVPPYQTGMTWNVAMPATPGEYEIRLLESNTYNEIAVSETITVGDVVDPPGGEAAVTVSATDVEPGETVVATMTGGPGNQYDWMVLVPVGAPSSGWVKMTFVPPYQTGMTWNVAMPATPGEYEIRLLENNSYNELAVSETITVGEVVEPPPSGGTPEVTVSATSAQPGKKVTVTMTGGPGNQYDWMVLVPVGAASSGWLKMTFVPQYQTSMTWNVRMPRTEGVYEVRLLEDNSYNLLATSPAITVAR